MSARDLRKRKRDEAADIAAMPPPAPIPAVAKQQYKGGMPIHRPGQSLWGRSGSDETYSKAYVRQCMAGGGSMNP